MSLSLFASLAAAAAASTAPSATACRLPPMEAPRLFGPGVISTGANDGAPTFSPDGRTLYFERSNTKWSAILESHRTGGRWSRPALAAFSGEGSDQQPALDPAGRFVVFASLRAGSGRKSSHLYRADRTASGWSAAKELPASVNISRRVFKPSVAANGDLYFMSGGDTAGPPHWKLYAARRQADGYAEAEPLGFTQEGDVDPYVAPDGSYLIFSSNSRPGVGDGHEHLYVVRHDAGRWGAVLPLRYAGDDWGADDGEAQVAPDGRELYFTSARVASRPAGGGRAQAERDAALMDGWNNGNGNAWSLRVDAALERLRSACPA